MEEVMKKIRSFRLIATSIKTTELLVAGCLSLVTGYQKPETSHQKPAAQPYNH